MTHLIASKTRLSPLKALSIPRVELMGAVIGLWLSRQVLTLDFGSEVRVESLNRSLHIGSARFTIQLKPGSVASCSNSSESSRLWNQRTHRTRADREEKMVEWPRVSVLLQS